MNSLILDNDTGLITDPKVIRHLQETLKAAVGDSLKCTLLGQGLCLAQIVSLNKVSCQLKLGEIVQGHSSWFKLVIGISRPQTVKKILEHATTYGAQQIHFFKATLSDKSYLDTKVLSENEKDEYLRAGLSQSGIYTELPEVKIDKYNPAQQYENEAQKFVLDLQGASSFLDQASSLNFNSPIILAVGPERGFVKEDIERFHRAGFKSIKISSSTLRVEHAVYSAISQLELLRSQF